MIREKVTVGEQPTPVCAIGWRSSSVILVNSGNAEVLVDTREDIAVDGPDAGLAIPVGQTVTIPKTQPDFPLSLWAVAPAGSGELTYLFPG